MGEDPKIPLGFNDDGSEPAPQGPYYTGAGRTFGDETADKNCSAESPRAKHTARLAESSNLLVATGAKDSGRAAHVAPSGFRAANCVR